MKKQNVLVEIKNRKPIIYLIGPSFLTKGGIGYVISRYFDSKLFYRYRLIHIATHVDGGSVKKTFFFLKSVATFITLRFKYGNGIMHLHSSSRTSFLRKACFYCIGKLFRMQLLFHIHTGSFYEYYCESNNMVKFIISYILRRADGVVILSPRWYDTIRQISDSMKALFIVPNPVDTEKYKPPLSPRIVVDRVELLFLGVIIQKKGVYDLIYAIRKLVDKGVNVTATIAGEREIDKAQKLCGDLNVLERVHFPGWVDEPTKLSLFDKCTIFAFPSYVEGLPLCVIEAMACGLPVVSTTIGGIPDLVINGENGFLHAPGDIESMVGAIMMLANDPILSERMGRANRERILKNYSLPVIEDTLNRVYCLLSTGEKK